MYFEHDSAILNTTLLFLCQQNLCIFPTTFSYCERLQVIACKVRRAGIFLVAAALLVFVDSLKLQVKVRKKIKQVLVISSNLSYVSIFCLQTFIDFIKGGRET